MQTLKEVHWEGDSKEVLTRFPEEVKRDIGFSLYALQQGEEPLDWRPLKSIGKSVFELRARDKRSWYRVVYLTKVVNKIFVLHSFEKKSSKTPQKDIELAKQRLKKVNERIREKK